MIEKNICPECDEEFIPYSQDMPHTCVCQICYECDQHVEDCICEDEE